MKEKEREERKKEQTEERVFTHIFLTELLETPRGVRGHHTEGVELWLCGDVDVIWWYDDMMWWWCDDDDIDVIW